MLRVVKSGNFSEPEKEVNVLSSCVVMVKSTRVKLGGVRRDMFEELREATPFSLANRCKIPGFSQVKISSGGVL